MAEVEFQDAVDQILAQSLALCPAFIYPLNVKYVDNAKLQGFAKFKWRSMNMKYDILELKDFMLQAN